MTHSVIPSQNVLWCRLKTGATMKHHLFVPLKFVMWPPWQYDASTYILHIQYLSFNIHFLSNDFNVHSDHHLLSTAQTNCSFSMQSAPLCQQWLTHISYNLVLPVLTFTSQWKWYYSWSYCYIQQKLVVQVINLLEKNISGNQ